MKRAVIVALVVLLVAPLSASAQGGYTLRNVIGSGGASAGRLVGTFGQPIATSPARLCAGFWCGGIVAAAVGVAEVVYRWTFDDMGIVAALGVLVALVGLRWLSDFVVGFWSERVKS